MATISSSPKIGYVYDSTDDTWYPLVSSGVAPHSHSASAFGLSASSSFVGTTDTQTLSNKTLGSNLAAGGFKVTGLGEPSAASDAPTKQYVDNTSNLLINGAMRVAQRATSVSSITTDGYRTADRWDLRISSAGTWTQSVENDAPTGSGFQKSLKMLCTTADASPASGDYCIITQRLEGQNLQQIAKGTSSAKQLSLSFWVKSNVTGTMIATLEDATNGRLVSAAYTVAASGTWEFKTVTFPADTTGALPNTNAEGMRLQFWLVAGSTYSGGGALGTTWNSIANTYAVGQQNVAAATNNYWQITGTQLNVGSTAAGFQHKTYAQELMACERYYWSGGNGSAGIFNGVTTARFDVRFPTTMRAAPTITAIAAPNVVNPTVAESQTGSQTTNFQATATGGLITVNAASKVQFGGFSLGADGRPCNLLNDCLAFSAEL